MRKLLNKSLEKGAQVADVYSLDRQIDMIQFNNNRLEEISSKNLAGFSLRVQKDQRLGIVSSSNFQRQDEILEMALATSKEGDTLDFDFTQPKERPDLTLTNDDLWQQTLEEYIADGEKAIQMIHDFDPNISVSFEVQRERETKRYLNTYGCDYQNTIDRLYLNLYGVLIQEKSVLAVPSERKLATNHYSIEEMAHEVIEKIKIGRVETSLEAGKMPILLTPAALSQICYVIVSGLSGENVRLGISPLKGRLGEQILHEGITLIDDMTLIGGSESATFDDEGTPGQRTILYENGVLKNYLLNLKSAQALNLKPNGKASRRKWWKPRDYAMSPTPWFSNWTMQPGDTPYEDMIADIKEGLVIDSAFGLLMGNMIAGEINTDIDMAYKIENGKIVGRVKDAAIGVNLYQIFKDQILAIENQTHFASSLASSGFMYLPHILLKDVNVIV